MNSKVSCAAAAKQIPLELAVRMISLDIVPEGAPTPFEGPFALTASTTTPSQPQAASPITAGNTSSPLVLVSSKNANTAPPPGPVLPMPSVSGSLLEEPQPVRVEMRSTNKLFVARCIFTLNKSLVDYGRKTTPNVSDSNHCADVFLRRHVHWHSKF